MIQGLGTCQCHVHVRAKTRKVSVDCAEHALHMHSVQLGDCTQNSRSRIAKSVCSTVHKIVHITKEYLIACLLPWNIPNDGVSDT